MSARLAFALAYAERGWHVHPLIGDTKRPRWKWGTTRAATTDVEQLTAWWQRHPDDGVAVATGPSRLLVVDLDGPAAVDAFGRLWHQAGAPEDWRTLQAQTPRGAHLFYARPDTERLSNTASRLAPGIDSRGVGGMVVMPPAPGRAWQRLAEVAPLPAPLFELLRPPPPRPVPEHRAGTSPRRIDGLVRAVAQAPDGQRNTMLNWAAFRVAQELEAGPELVEAFGLLADVGHRAGLTATEVRDTLASAQKAAGVAA